MRPTIWYIFIIIATVCANAQTVQFGVVKEYNEKEQKTPLAGVELNVRSATSTASDKNGKFSLSFLTLKPGEKVNVRRIEKLGYEVFNKEAIEQWNLNPKNPFIIVMCKSDKFKRIRDNYERVSSASYARQLKKEEAALAKLKKEGKLKETEYQKKLADLQENYERQLDNLENYIDRFSRIDLSELSEIEREVIDLVQQGKIEEAIAKYEAQNFLEKYGQEVDKINKTTTAITYLKKEMSSAEESRDSLLAAMNRQINMYALAGGDENLQKIENLYEGILAKDKTNLEVTLEYMVFLNTYFKYEKALNIYDCVKPYLDNNPKYQEQFMTKIGNSYNQLQQLSEAIDIYHQGLNIIKTADIEDEGYRDERICNILGNLGLAYYRKGDLENALSSLEMVIHKKDSLAIEDMSLLRSMSTLSNLYRTTKKYGKADSILNAGLNIMCRMDYIDNKKKEENVYAQAIFMQGRGNIAADNSNLDSARKYYSKALTILDSLYTINPRKYVASYAILNYNMGRTYFIHDQKSKECLPYYIKSLDLYESILNESFIQELFNNYTQTFSHVGRIYCNVGDTIGCLNLCERGKKLLDICIKFPYKGALLMGAISSTYSDIKKYDSAIEYGTKAVDAIKIMYAEYPDIYRPDLAKIYMNLGMSACNGGELVIGKECFIMGSGLFKQLYEDKQVPKNEYFEVLSMGYVFLVTSSEPLEGIKYLRKMQELSPENRKLFEDECAILYEIGETEEANLAFKKLLNHFPDYPKDSEIYKTFSTN